MSLLYSRIGSNIRSAREEQRKTQADLAEALEITPSHYSNMERGIKHFSLMQVARIALYLKVPLSALFAGTASEGCSAEDKLQHTRPIVQQAALDFSNIIKDCSENDIAALLKICSIFVDGRSH